MSGSVTGASPFDTALERLRLSGAIFFRSEFTEAWAYLSPPAQDIARMLHPGAPRLIMFHIVAQGRCWVAVDDGIKHWAEPGDVLVLPYGDQHSVGGNNDAVVVPIHELFPEPPWDTLPVLQYGLGGERTDIVCGYLHSTDPLFDPEIGALPRVFVVRLLDEATARWVQASIDYAVTQSEVSLTSTSAPTRLPEMLLTEVLRAHLATAPAISHGWIAALNDPVLAPALSQLHHAPAQHWSLADLASAASVSRSVLDERFRRVLGRSPMRYLAEWRMHTAADLLRSTDFTIARVAREVGYDSEEAFSRAFKRQHGIPPSQARTGGA